ncbi:MAG: phosphatase PAP2 family protein [Alphaproteobacteria bacterium]|nr:phosphatase PAP2 family protein [Alphaproteobacteria bacterium]
MLVETYLLLITSLGNAVVVGALVITACVYLVVAGSRRPALALACAFGLAALGVCVAKLLCMGCHSNPLDPALRSPSGHVAISTAVYGMLTAIITARMNRWQSVLAWIGAISLILLIAASRVLLGFHTFDEVIVGFVIGGTSYALARRFALRKETIKFNGLALAATAAVVIVIFHGVQFPFEQAIQWLALYIRHNATVC